MRRAPAAGLAILLAGCGGGGGGPSAQQVLRDTSARIGAIHSADFGLRLVLEPREHASAGRVGFDLRGPVALRRSGLPVAKLRYTQIAGPRQGGATFISTGRDAFVDVGGTAYRLPAAQTAALRRSAAAVRSGARLPVGRWVVDPRREDGGRVGGAQTDHVSARLDAVAALRDIFGAARRAGASVPDLAGARADELRKAIDEATIDVWSGRDDHLLRRLRLRIGFRSQLSETLRRRLGAATGGRFAFDVDVGSPNAPVSVAAPANPRPASALPGG